MFMPQGQHRSMLQQLGDTTWTAVSDVGQFSRFSGRMFLWLVRGKIRWRSLAPQLYEIGVRSIPVVLVTGVFVGMVLAVQIYEQLSGFSAQARAGRLINMSVIRELGPVLAGVMLAGRVGGALAAELGTMKVTEQIDALSSLGADPIRYLVVPRFLACLLLIPFLTVYCDIVGVIGGYAVVCGAHGAPSADYWYYSAQTIETYDIMAGIIKSVFFGGAIALISCYKGFTCKSGAAGVGRAATEAFVLSFIAILIINLLMSVLFITFYEMVWGTSPGAGW
jgi:phospholipid/cholesterol/gamma-HCH transport system permease protein